MLYAKVVLGLAVEGPFDYIVPSNLSKKIKIGVRVGVSFGTKKTLGYVVKLTQKTSIKNLKPILEVIDDTPILDKNMLLLTKGLSDYYCCSWGQAIDTALPQALRKGKKIPSSSINSKLTLGEVKGSNIKEAADIKEKDKKEAILIHDLSVRKKWDIYLQSIEENLRNNRSVIVLLPDISSVLKTKEMIVSRLGISPGLLYRKQPKELEEWLKVRDGKVNIVIGTRSSIFAPINNLGLVIIDQEQDSAYKQDQVPHYNAREIAFMRTDIEKAKLILASAAPSLESYYLAKKHKIKYIFIPQERNFPEIKIINMKYLSPVAKRRNIFLSRYLEDSIISGLNSKVKILLFLNRRGFATFASCRQCGVVLRCPRCNINLVYHFKDSILNCHYCNFRIQAPVICPNCNSGYIRYSGIGTEKVESELSRLFPQARIKRLDDNKLIDDADIFVSTKSIIKQTNYDFDLIGVLFIDNSLNRVDFQASEKTYHLLIGLLGLAKGKLIIQTNVTNHHCFRALESKNVQIFYDEELKQRRQLNFPPYSHIGLVKLRGEKEARVKEVSNVLFKVLNRYNKSKNLKIISANPSQPAKLRGKFCWQILIKSEDAEKISRFLKINLKYFPHSGIIVTVDMDPT